MKSGDVPDVGVLVQARDHNVLAQGRRQLPARIVSSAGEQKRILARYRVRYTEYPVRVGVGLELVRIGAHTDAAHALPRNTVHHPSDKVPRREVDFPVRKERVHAYSADDEPIVSG